MPQIYPGPGDYASRAVRWRARGDYQAAAALEAISGERRRFGSKGETLHEISLVIPREFSKRCDGGSPEHDIKMNFPGIKIDLRRGIKINQGKPT